MVEWPTRAQQSHRGRKAWRGEGREWCGRTSDRRERGASVAFLAAPRRFSAVALRARAGTKRRTPPEAGLAQRARVGQWAITSRGILFATVPDALCGSGIETRVSGAGPASGLLTNLQGGSPMDLWTSPEDRREPCGPYGQVRGQRLRVAHRAAHTLAPLAHKLHRTNNR